MFTSCVSALCVSMMISALSCCRAAGLTPFRYLLQQTIIIDLPAVVEDHRREIDVHLVTSCYKVVDGCNPLRNWVSPNVHTPGKPLRHQPKANSRLALWIPV